MSLLLALLLLAAGETPFAAGGGGFADAAACRAHLAELAATARAGRYDAVEGPYEIAPDDVRMHTVAAEGNGHRIEERRCLGAELSARSWTRSMEAEEEAFTVETVARSAPWLNKGTGQQ